MRKVLSCAAALTWALACSAEAPLYEGTGSLAPPVDTAHAPKTPDPTFADLDGGPPQQGPVTNPALQPMFGDTIVQSASPPPIFGGTLAIAHGGNLAIASDPDRDRVYLVDLAARTVVHAVDVGEHALPFRIAEDGARRAHVTLRGTGELATIDLVSGQIVQRRWVCAEPRGVAYEAATDRVHVACDGGQLVSLQADGGDAVRTVALNRGLRDIVVDGDSLVVSRFRQAKLVRVSADGTPSPEFGPVVVKGVEAEVAWRTIANPAGGVTMLHQRASTKPIDIAAAQVSSYGGCGSAVVESVLTPFVPNAPQKVAPGLMQMVVPVDVAYAPDGVTALVVSPGNSRTRALVGYGFFGPKEQPPMPCWNEGPPPDPLPIDPSFHPNQYVAAAFDGQGHAILQSREPAALVLIGEKLPHKELATISLSDVSRADTGHMIFHSNSGAFLACASCHPEGGDDGHVWTFADQNLFARRTPSLRGTVKGTAPYHWDGAFPDVPSLVDDVFSRRMGGPALVDPAKKAIQHWVEAIPAPQPEPSADWSAVSRGAELFNGSAKCSTCHTGVRRTNNMTVNVGTGAPMQTPSLVGISARAPFMHDGCASTLEQRFGVGVFADGAASRCGGGDHHGQTSQLSPAQIADLVAYLNAI